MSIEADVVRRYIEDLWSDGHLDNAGSDYFSNDFVAHDPHAEDVRGYQKFVSMSEQLLKGFSITDCTIDHLISEHDMVAAHYTMRGKQTGFLFGLPPTNKNAEMEGVGIFRVADGKIAEAWGVTDSLETLQQLGLLPQIGSREATSA